MVAKTESIQQTTTGTWAASSTVTVLLDRIGLVTQYDLLHRLTPSATFLAANQPDGLYRPFQNIQIIAGGLTYFALPSDGGGEGGVLQHFLNIIDGLGIGYPSGAITAPDLTYVPIKLSFHAGVRPFKRDGGQNLFDLTAFVPAGMESAPQVTWTTNGSAVVDDAVTLSSGVLTITAHRVLGTTADIMQEMMLQGVTDILALVQSGAEGVLPNPNATGFIPSWIGQVQSPIATAADFSLELDAQLGGFLKRVTFLAQDATATRPARAEDELTALRLSIPERGIVVFQGSTEVKTGMLPMMPQLGVDDVVAYGGASAKGFYPYDLRTYSPTTLERIMGYDTRGRQTGYAKWQQTLDTNASGDDILVLTERSLVYQGRLSNS